MSERIIGRPMPIIDAVEKVSGATVFINDLELPGALVGHRHRLDLRVFADDNLGDVGGDALGDSSSGFEI